jgi:hypothetical protein
MGELPMSAFFLRDASKRVAMPFGWEIAHKLCHGGVGDCTVYCLCHVATQGSPRTVRQKLMSRAVQEFELHDDTLAEARLEMHPLTMRFTTPAAERDFLRFRNKGRVAIVIATFASNCFAYGSFLLATPNLAVAVAVAADLLGLLGEIVFVACSRPTGIERQAARAIRHERISAAANMVSNLAWAAGSASVYQLRCGSEPTQAAYRQCMRVFDLVVMLALTTVLFAPRLTYIAPMNVLVTVVYVLSTNLSYAYYDPIDYVSDGVVYAGYMIALNIAAWVKERREREFFLTVVELQRVNLDVDRQRDAMRAVLAAVLPASLLQGGALSEQGVSHHSTHATVAVTDIYSFSAWTTWHLEVEVVWILHALMSAYDTTLVAHYGVERAMTYGDAYIVCSGLLEPHPEHADAVMQCALAQRDEAVQLSSKLPRGGLDTRTSIFTGELRGTSIGTTSRRYAVTGPALDAAVDRIGLCERNGIVAGSHAAESEAATLSGGGGRDEAPETVLPSSNHESPAAAPERFSRLWLIVHDAPPESATELRSVTIADGVVPAVIITALLTAVLAEHASADTSRHHSNQPLGLGLLCAGFVIAWGTVVALVAAKGRLPVAVATALKVIPRALAGYGVVLLYCNYAKPGTTFAISLGILCRFDRAVPWMLQVFFVCVSTLVPSAIYSQQHSPGDVRQLVITGIAVPTLCVVHRYFTVRAACEHSVAAMSAADNVTRADEQSRAVENLLAGLLPPHAIAVFDCAPRTDVSWGPTAFHHWPGLSLLQIKLHCDGQVLQKVWDRVAKAIGSEHDGLLELVQASGDTLLVGGPFVTAPTEAQHVAAARQVLVFLQELVNHLKSIACTFTAVATSGAAYGALLGAANVTYRMFGAAVRENDAIMAAVPRPIGEPRNIAFVSDSFRRQERNFAVRHHGAAIHDAAMSAAFAASHISGSGDGSGDVGGDAAGVPAFGAAMLWRAVGLGAIPVSTVKM